MYKTLKMSLVKLIGLSLDERNLPQTQLEIIPSFHFMNKTNQSEKHLIFFKHDIRNLLLILKSIK